MLEHTFCHIHGIGSKTEQRLWNRGILHWRDLDETALASLSRRSQLEIPLALERSLEALEDNNPHFFSDRLSSSDQWRLFHQFRPSIAYLDIETTGLHEECEITTIALYDGNHVSTYINGRNLLDFITDIANYSILVSYNGKSFDVPFIEHYFQTKLPQAHIDLRFVLAKLGFKGGLKGCEKQLGINRGILDGLDGSFAVYLWRQYERYNDEKALETLLAYNIEDTVNLERLLVEACNRYVQQTPFADELLLPFPVEPVLPYQPDFDCVRKVQQHYYRK